jgi:hypothetical protein
MRAGWAETVRVRTPAAVSLVVCLAVSASAASAARIGGEDASSPDAREYAAAFELDHEEASRRLSQQGELGPLKERVRALAGDRVAEVSTEHDEFFGLSVTLTAGPEIPGIEQLLDASGHRYRLTYTAVLGESEGVALASELVATTLSGVGGVDGLYYDGASGTVFIDYSGGRGRFGLVKAATVAAQRGVRLHVNFRSAPAGDGPALVEHTRRRGLDGPHPIL